MISYKKAVIEILSNCKPKTITLPISKAINCIAAKNVFSKRDNPSFDNSLLDGFAVKSTDVQKNKVLTIAGKISAGEKKKIKYKKNSCYQIATGCPIQLPFDSMIPYEQVIIKNKKNIQVKMLVKKFQNVRKKSSDFKKNSLILKKGTQIQASTLLAAKTLGISKIEVYSKPKIILFCSGDEISDNPSHINKTINGISEYLESFKNKYNYDFEYLGVVKDSKKDLKKVYNKIKKNKLKNTIFISTGGVSMGHKDFIPSALKKNKYKIIFHKMNMKPGRPTLFARKKDNFYFGLPGNPIATIVGFHFLIVPLIKKLQSKKISWNTGVLSNSQIKKSDMALLLRGKRKNRNIKILPGQESYKISTLLKANCWVLLDQNNSFIKRGSKVKYISYEN
jgi:molybdopterin molybdotransferase